MLIKKDFINEFTKSFEEFNFLKLLISKPLNKSSSLLNISIKIIEIKKEYFFSFLFKYKTKDIVKNYSFNETISELDKILWIEFKNAVLFTEKNDINLSYNKKMDANIAYAKATWKKELSIWHSNEKKKLIKIENNIYLKELWLLTESWVLIKNKQSKFKQINKYIEIIDWIIRKSELEKEWEINLVDMWSWKWYLTFAIYDFLKNILKLDIKVRGIEMRENLVELCNDISKKCDFNDLSFIQNCIQDFKSDNIDILIALHACDTATDDAIFKWIISNSKIIITSPCCHKQIRKELNPKNELKDIINHWILKERQAELLTDTMRWLILEAYWYKTQIFEFITYEHTHKNIMIVWQKSSHKNNKIEFFKKISNLKQIFWIKNFYLEDLLKNI